MAELGELLRLGKSKEEAMDDICGVSPFAKLLSGEMQMLSPKSRTESQEETAREERKG